MNQQNSDPFVKLSSAVSAVSLFVMILTGFTFQNMFVVGAIWTAMHAVIYQHSQKKFYLYASIVSVIILLIGAFGLFMDS